MQTEIQFEIRVGIKEEYKKVLPIPGIQSRVALAEIFSFMDYKDRVCHLLQRLNHRTRAYIVNAEGLKGFCKVGLGIMNMFTDENRRVIFASVCEREDIAVEQVSGELRAIKDHNKMLMHLQEFYPGLAHFYVCKITGDEGLFCAQEFFKKFEFQSPYSLYVHGFLLPALKQLYARGDLTDSRSGQAITIADYNAIYEGQVDRKGRPCGMGIARVIEYRNGCPRLVRIFEGSFVKGYLHGVCVEKHKFASLSRMVYDNHTYTKEETFQWKNGQKHKVGTIVTYHSRCNWQVESITNIDNGSAQTTSPEGAFYWKGKPTKNLRFSPTIC